MMLIGILLVICSLVSSQANHTKPLKALWNLEEVCECTLHYRALVYNNYGCWCGVGGSHEPVDEIDECCMHHDKCYDAAVDSKICYDVAWEYIDDYKWRCMNGTATCTVAYGSLYNFVKIGKCILGRNPMHFLLGHGCYCGFGNYGDDAPFMDEYDKCCKEHDDCYGKMTNATQKSERTCPNTFVQYIANYRWTCDRHNKNATQRATCKPTGAITEWLWDQCALELCKCDRQMMICWERVQKETGRWPSKLPCSKALANETRPGWLRFLEYVTRPKDFAELIRAE